MQWDSWLSWMRFHGCLTTGMWNFLLSSFSVEELFLTSCGSCTCQESAAPQPYQWALASLWSRLLWPGLVLLQLRLLSCQHTPLSNLGLCISSTEKRWFHIWIVYHKKIYGVNPIPSLAAQGHLAFRTHSFTSISVYLASRLRNVCVRK